MCICKGNSVVFLDGQIDRTSALNQSHQAQAPCLSVPPFSLLVQNVKHYHELVSCDSLRCKIPELAVSILLHFHTHFVQLSPAFFLPSLSSLILTLGLNAHTQDTTFFKISVRKHVIFAFLFISLNTVKNGVLNPLFSLYLYECLWF